MKTSFSVLKAVVALVALVACVSLAQAQAQNRERFGISAKAGGVNAVTGRVSVKREGKPARLLTSQDDLESGDVVNTGVSGQIEVLLNPGTYLRLAERSEFVMEDTSLDNLLVRLTKGSAIVEATGPDDLKVYVPIVTAQHRMTIIRPGVYRINALPETTELFVRKGRMSLSDNKEDYVKGGKKVTFAGGEQQIAKVTDKDTDQFDDWSKSRGQTLAVANARLQARTVNGYLLANTSAFSGSNWGWWTWSPFSGCYTFLPFRHGWGSPYGGSYGQYAFPYGGSYNNNPYYPNVITSNGSNGNTGYGNGSGSGSSGSSGTGSNGGYYGGGSSGGGSAGSSGGSSGGRSISTPTMSAPSQAGPRDPDSGSRSINTIKNPQIN